MVRKSFTFALFAGIPAGVLVASVVTLTEWWKNPGGIYRTQAGTHWHIAWQTWSSWFIPVAMVVFILVWVIAIVVFWQRSRRLSEGTEVVGETGS